MYSVLAAVTVPLDELAMLAVRTPDWAIFGFGVALSAVMVTIVLQLGDFENGRPPQGVLVASWVVSLGLIAPFSYFAFIEPGNRTEESRELVAEQVEYIEDHYGVVFIEEVTSLPLEEHEATEVTFYPGDDVTTQYSGTLFRTGENELTLLVDGSGSEYRTPWVDATPPD